MTVHSKVAPEQRTWQQLSLGDEQSHFSHVHQFGPALHGGGVDVRDNVGERRVLFGRENNQHADAAALVGKLDHLVLLPERRGGHAWRGSQVKQRK